MSSVVDGDEENVLDQLGDDELSDDEHQEAVRYLMNILLLNRLHYHQFISTLFCKHCTHVQEELFAIYTQNAIHSSKINTVTTYICF